MDRSAASERLIVFAGSARRNSANKHLARIVADELHRRDREVEFVDLADFEMPLYHGDLEAESGPPEAAHRLTELFATAGGFLIASPEYNGAMSGLLKNTIDWVTRVDYSAFSGKFIGLMSATPGRRGGANGLGLVRQWFEYMRLNVADETLSIPHIHDVLDASGERPELTAGTHERVVAFLDRYLEEFDEHRTLALAS